MGHETAILFPGRVPKDGRQDFRETPYEKNTGLSPVLCFFIQLWPRSFFRLWIFRGRDLWSAVLPLFWLCGRVPAFRAFARPFPGSQPGPSSLTASAASRRFSLRLGVVPAAGAGVIGSNGVLGGPGLTVASPKALVRNRVHWTHLFPFL